MGSPRGRIKGGDWRTAEEGSVHISQQGFHHLFFFGGFCLINSEKFGIYELLCLDWKARRERERCRVRRETQGHVSWEFMRKIEEGGGGQNGKFEYTDLIWLLPATTILL